MPKLWKFIFCYFLGNISQKKHIKPQSVEQKDEPIPEKLSFNVKTTIQTPIDEPRENHEELSAVERLRKKNKGGDGNEKKFDQINKDSVLKN